MTACLHSVITHLSSRMAGRAQQAIVNSDERCKAGSSNDPKRIGREKESNKSNTTRDYKTRLSATGAASFKARKGNTCGSNFIDDDGTEDVKREEKAPEVTKVKSKIGTFRRRMGREKVETNSEVDSEGASYYM